MTVRRMRIGAAVVLLAALGLAGASPELRAADEDALMRTEDVVRMLVRGLSTEEILNEIRTRPARFDVTPDMLEELRRAGVSDELIEAMIERMAELEPSPDPVKDAADDAPSLQATAPSLTVRLEPRPEEGKRILVRVRGAIDLRLREAWLLEPSAEGQPFEDLALFLVCRTATHVPDHWRSKSPLGRDFISMPRHRMLVFLTADEQGQETSDTGTLELRLPASFDVALEPVETHDLSLGFAVEADGRYMRWADDTWDGLTIGSEGLEVRAEVRSGSRGEIDELEIRFDRTQPDPAAR